MYNIIEWTKSDIGNLLENTLDREKWKINMYNVAIQIPPTTNRGHRIKDKVKIYLYQI